jgi:hypothetical protein
MRFLIQFLDRKYVLTNGMYGTLYELRVIKALKRSESLEILKDHFEITSLLGTLFLTH